MMNTFEVGDRVRVAGPSYLGVEQATGTVISPLAWNSWCVTVRLDSGIKDIYAAAHLEHVEVEDV